MTTHPTGGASGAPDTRRPELVEFLLARIAEDEAPRVRAAWHEDWCLDPSDVADGRCGYCGNTEDPRSTEEVPPSPRVLAECAAKRMLIERVGNPSWAGFEILATVYADHPDYREEWRP